MPHAVIQPVNNRSKLRATERRQSRATRKVRESNLRKQPSPERIQYVFEESFCLDGRLIIQAIAVEFIYRGRGNDNPFRKAILQDI